jgi:hypothetical protein
LDNVGATIKKSRVANYEGSTHPFAGADLGGSDFGPFGKGMGRMGGIHDIFKIMGGGMSGGI